MPNDARLGMVIGVSVVIAFPVLFFRKDVPAIAGNCANVAETSTFANSRLLVVTTVSN